MAGIDDIEATIYRNIVQVLKKDFIGCPANKINLKMIENSLLLLLKSDHPDFSHIRNDVRFNKDSDTVEITPLNIFSGLIILQQYDKRFDDVVERTEIIRFPKFDVHRYSDEFGEYCLTIHNDDNKPEFVFIPNQPIKNICITFGLTKKD